MRAFSSTLIAELRKEVFSTFWLIEIPFSSAYPTRYIDIDIDIHHGGERYFSYPFKIGDITYTSDMAIDSVNIEVANVDLSMSALLLGSDVAGVEATISFGCLDSNYQVLGVKDIFYGEISGWKILRDKSVELTVVNEFMLWRKKTLRIAQASCRWPFKGMMSDGLVGYWPFDVGSGVVAVDKTQNENDGILDGCTWIGGVSGSAIQFDYTADDHIDVADFAGLDFGTGDFSISCWAIINAFNDQGSAINCILFRGNRSSTPGCQYGLVYHADGYPRFTAGDGDEYAQFSIDMTDSAWHHIVGVRESGTLKIYVDAVKGTDGVYSALDIDGAEGLKFGGDGLTTRYLDGSIDEIRIYNRALPQAEITFLYNNPAPDECHYGGAQTWCDQTYARCAVLTNEDNFGGFRFLPYIMEKQIWWGGPKPTD